MGLNGRNTYFFLYIYNTTFITSYFITLVHMAVSGKLSVSSRLNIIQVGTFSFTKLPTASLELHLF